MFRNAKVGDRVWDFLKGWGTVIDISWDEDYPIFVKFDYEEFKTCFTYKGFADKDDKKPRLFWDEIKFEIPEKPFDLEKELRELDKIEFRTGKDNYFLAWSNKWECINNYSTINLQNPFLICFTEESINNFMDNIKDKKITKEQFFTAYKNVFGGMINE